MQFNNNYYSAMDRMSGAQNLGPLEPAEKDDFGDVIVPDEALNFTAKDIGTTTNPMGNTLESLKAKIREGASKIEFEFLGRHKGNSQQPTPESFGTRERQDMRELLKINEVRTSTHAAVHANSLAGFTQRGFNEEARADVLNEIKKAIHFAGEATKGGAVTFHIHEWQRPLSGIADKSGAKFQTYEKEDEDAVLFAVDARTGELVSTISKNREIFRPIFKTAKDEGLVGQKDADGNILQANDWIDVANRKIPKNAPVERLFDRVPMFNKDQTNFKVQKLKWEDLVKETQEWNKNNPDKPPRTEEEMFAIIQIENRVLQAKGASLYHARVYEDEKRRRDLLQDEYEAYMKLKESLPEEEQWKLNQFHSRYEGQLFSKHDDETYEQTLRRAIKSQENSMRHIHESSSSADVQAKEAEEMINNIQSSKRYGLEKTADTIAKAAVYAMKTYEANKEKYELTEPLYVAPENWSTKNYGSHPDEYIEVIKASRAKMADLLVKTQGRSKAEAEELAKNHIKGTLDIGHLNNFREHFQGDPKDFDKWMLSQAERLVREGYVGHIHLTDNFGFDDEHLTPGQGNVPMREFLKKMEALGMRDMTVEPGSFNPTTSMLDTLSYINSPVYGVTRRLRFGNMHEAHFGYNAPGFFIAGAYSPSNDWKPWTDIPLE